MCHLLIKQQLKRGGGEEKAMKTGATSHKNAVGQLRKPTQEQQKSGKINAGEKRHLFFPMCMDKPGNRSWVG